jgi:hypothetical protein
MSAPSVVSPLSVRDSKSDVHVTCLRQKQAVLAAEIRHAWKETLESIVQTGVWLAEGRFRKADYARYGLPFSYSWGKRLTKIARSARILNPANRSVLPDKAGALHEISLLTDRLFDLAVAEGIVNRECLVIDIKQFRQSFLEPGQVRRRCITVVYQCDPGRDRSALDTLDSFLTAVQQLAAGRFPDITARPPRRIKELVPS